MDTWSFRCTACGKCCNSAPQMSVAELFHHARRFVGCLTIRRIPRGAVASLIAHRVPAAGDYDVLLATQAYDVSDRCPALEADGRCAIHFDRKPLHCHAVPLDPLLPDASAGAVLAARAQDAAAFGADCIQSGARRDYSVVVRRLAVVGQAQSALAARRRALVEERRLWGDAVFRMLARDLFDDAQAVARLPIDGHFTMSIAPVILALATSSASERARCRAYVDAQIALLASLPRDPQLVAFARTHASLRRALEVPS